MTTDERAAACAEEIDDTLGCPIDWKNMEQVIARHIRESVAERDALLRECLAELDGLGFGDLRARITAMIGGHDDE